jgi:hypothetical protein
MAFPGTYNINYYIGDTYEFRVYPKTANGDAYSLSPFVYDDDNNPATVDFDSAVFAFAEERASGGPTTPNPAGYHECYAKISDDRTYVTCAIRPDDAQYLDPTKTYVYDVQISRHAGGADYKTVITLMTGNITVTGQVVVPDNIG